MEDEKSRSQKTFTVKMIKRPPYSIDVQSAVIHKKCIHYLQTSCSSRCRVICNIYSKNVVEFEFVGIILLKVNQKVTIHVCEWKESNMIF